MSKQQMNDKYSSAPMKPDQVAKHALIADQIAEFEARGGRVEQIESGVFGEDLTAKRPQPGANNRKKGKK